MNIKGMDRDMQCRGYQFEVGKEYKINSGGRPLELCSDTVFHYCKSLSQVHNYYDCNNENNRYFEIEVLGEEITGGEKCGSNHIKIVREIVGTELDTLKGLNGTNTGLFNSGDRNSGDMNSGNRNSGIANKCDFSNGVFCNESDMDIRIFNKPSGMSLRDFLRSKYWDAMCSASFDLTEWVWYTAEEKANDPEKERVSGYLKVNTYEEAWANWWANLNEENRQIIQEIPNFDPAIFKDITGIEI